MKTTTPKTNPTTTNPTDDAIVAEVTQRAAMDRLLDRAVKPHAEAIARIALRGGVAVVVFEPMPQARKAATALGWDGTAPVFELTPDAPGLRGLAKSDAVTAAWLKRKDSPADRILVIAQGGTLLVNYTPGVGFSIEPGSTCGAPLN